MGSRVGEESGSVIAVVTSVCAVFGAIYSVCVCSLIGFEFSKIHVSDLITFICVTRVTPNY